MSKSAFISKIPVVKGIFHVPPGIKVETQIKQPEVVPTANVATYPNVTVNHYSAPILFKNLNPLP